jgi:hypothetical protein
VLWTVAACGSVNASSNDSAVIAKYSGLAEQCHAAHPHNTCGFYDECLGDPFWGSDTSRASEECTRITSFRPVPARTASA